MSLFVKLQFCIAKQGWHTTLISLEMCSVQQDLCGVIILFQKKFILFLLNVKEKTNYWVESKNIM